MKIIILIVALITLNASASNIYSMYYYVFPNIKKLPKFKVFLVFTITTLIYALSCYVLLNVSDILLIAINLVFIDLQQRRELT
jgi:hypothetical protein